MDAVRKRIVRALKDRGLEMKTVSLEIGKNHAYLQQFLERGIPAKLKEDVRSRLSEVLDVPEEELGAPQRALLNDAKTLPFVDEIDVTAGLGGGGLSIVENTTTNGITFHREAVRDVWRLPDNILARFNAQAHHIKAFPSKGDSMAPQISDGDIVFADTRHRWPSPPGLYAVLDEIGGIVVKRIEVSSEPGAEQQMISVISDNPRHKPREWRAEDLFIVGRVLRKFGTVN